MSIQPIKSKTSWLIMKLLVMIKHIFQDKAKKTVRGHEFEG